MGRRGFTQVELLGVLAIIAIVVVAVTLGVIGFRGRGGEQSYNTDENTLQTAVSAFYSDKHSYDPVNGWNEAKGGSSDFNFPTRSSHSSDLYPGDVVEINGRGVRLLMEAGDGSLADTEDVVNAAIWMGLLVNQPGSGSGIAPVPDTKDNSAPLFGESGLYLMEVPESCSAYNSSSGKGTYTWIVGRDGKVYGVFEVCCVWYVGYSGKYP